LLLGSLLLGAGLGSMASARIAEHHLSVALGSAALAVAVAVGLVMALLGLVFEHIVRFTLLTDAAAIILLLGLGFVMGIPFPLAIRALKSLGMESEVPWMWAINGAASVFGSILAIVAAIQVGYSADQAIGITVYATIGLLMLARQWHPYTAIAGVPASRNVSSPTTAVASPTPATVATADRAYTPVNYGR